MYRKRLSTVVFLLGFVFLLSSCGDEQSSMPPTSVTFMKVPTKDITLKAELSGRISAFYVSEVRPQVGGIIKERFFEEGADVKEGDILYQIDPALYQAAYDNAVASLAQAEARAKVARLLANRYSQLVGSKAVSQQEYDNARADHDRAKAEVLAAKSAVDTAKINLDYTKVTAPVSGRIGRSSVTKGALVTQHQGEPLAVIQQTEQMYVDVSQPSFQTMKMRQNLGDENMDVVTLFFQDGTEYPLKGSVDFYDITVDEGTDMVNVRLIFPNDSNLLPGMYARAQIIEKEVKDAILLPQKIVPRDNKGDYTLRVLVKPSPKALEKGLKLYGDLAHKMMEVTSRVVTVDRVVGVNSLYITEGVSPGENILYGGLQKVQIGGLVLASEVDYDGNPVGQSKSEAGSRGK